MKTKDERYMSIAKSCLKVLTSQSILEQDKQKNIDELYYAIEGALGEEFQTLLNEYAKLETCLREIAALDEAKNPDAVAKAKKVFYRDPSIH